MKSSLIIDHLQNLKAVLRKILGYSSIVGDKYIGAIQGAIDRISYNKDKGIKIEEGRFRGEIKGENGNLEIKVYLIETDDLIEAIRFRDEDVFSDEIIGET